jgi:invasion protein IalB
MSLSNRMAIAAVASLLLAGSAFAQTAPAAAPAAKTDTAAPAAKTETAPAAATDKKVHSAISLECSRQADEKGLKGKERKKFRRECKKAGADKK